MLLLQYDSDVRRFKDSKDVRNFVEGLKNIAAQPLRATISERDVPERLVHSHGLASSRATYGYDDEYQRADRLKSIIVPVTINNQHGYVTQQMIKKLVKSLRIYPNEVEVKFQYSQSVSQKG